MINIFTENVKTIQKIAIVNNKAILLEKRIGRFVLSMVSIVVSTVLYNMQYTLQGTLIPRHCLTGARVNFGSRLAGRRWVLRPADFSWERSSEIIIKYLFMKIALGMSVPYGI